MEYRKAPDNQPTENIELQLRTAENGIRDWISEREYLAKRLESANRMIDSLGERRDELAWQLEQRKNEEKEGK